MARVDEILKRYGFQRDATTTWNVQGNKVIYHAVLEAIAAELQIEWLPPQILRAEPFEAVILVQGTMDGKLQWAIGEALVGVNYRVSGKQAAYVYAMAEKRGKDRVIYKFLGLAEQFDDSAAEEARPADASIDVSKMSILEKVLHNVARKGSVKELNDWTVSEPVKLALQKLQEPELTRALHAIDERRRVLAEEATSRSDDGIWPDLLNKAKIALSKAKNEQEVNSYETMMREHEFVDATADALEAFAKICEGRRYELRTR